MGAVGAYFDNLTFQPIHQRRILSLWIVHNNIIVRHQKSVFDFTLCRETFAASRSALNQAIRVLQLFPVHHDKVVGQGVQAVIQAFFARLVKFLCGERNEDGGTAGGQPSLNFDLTVCQRQTAHQPLLLLEIQPAQVAVVLLGDAGCLKNIVFQFLFSSAGVQHQKSDEEHSLILALQFFQQEQGLMSSLPLADCQIEIQRGLTTSSTAIFIPFTTQELYQSGKESLYYGLNALSNNLIMVDRKKLKNPNGLILGTPGSGKSFSAKREIAYAFLVTDDDIIVNDPEGEYSPLVNRLKGQVIKISPKSTQFVNPMDINANYSEEDNPLSLKADFILSLCELVVALLGYFDR